MQRAAGWVIGVAACTLLVAGCTNQPPQASARTAADTEHHRKPVTTNHQLEELWKAVAFYEGIAARGGWPTLPDSARARLGDTVPAVAVLKERLVTTGDLRRSSFDRIRSYRSRNLFDVETEAALRSFQARHGLEPDGVLGRQTRSALDVPAAARVRQLRSNLWRAQQAPQLDAGRVLLVNIPDYRLQAYEDGTPVLDMRVVVGTEADPTPAFSDLMTYVVFRPYWNVPTSIALEELVPQIQRDPRVLKRKNLEVVVAAARESVLADSMRIDWSRFDRSGYMLRRRPGGRNPLGDIKFMFPNPYSVYLHDTPQDKLFQKDDRTYSHGCVRIEKPVDLAEFVLRDTPGWDRDSIGVAMWVGETKTVRLKKPVPTHIVYWTAWVDDGGRVQFRDDIYHLDDSAGSELVAAPQ